MQKVTTVWATEEIGDTVFLNKLGSTKEGFFRVITYASKGGKNNRILATRN